MKLYHGTSYETATKIIKDKKIKCGCESPYDDSADFSTNKNYIYLTNNIALAIRYAKNATKNEDKKVSIFIIEIDESKLLPDFDELKQQTQELSYIKRTFVPKVEGEFTLEKSLKMFNSCCVAEDISANEYDMKYFDIESFAECKRPGLFGDIEKYLFLSRGRDEDYSKEWKELASLERELLKLYEIKDVCNTRNEIKKIFKKSVYIEKSIFNGDMKELVHNIEKHTPSERPDAFLCLGNIIYGIEHFQITQYGLCKNNQDISRIAEGSKHNREKMKDDRDFDYEPSINNLIKALSRNLRIHSKNFDAYKKKYTEKIRK